MAHTWKTLLTVLAWTALAASSALSLAQDSTKKPVSLFDGKTLQGWSGLSENWKVEDGAITGVNTAENPLKNNTFLVSDKKVSDFELTLEFKIDGGNSGIQYRSKLIDADKFIVGGYQADIDANKRYMGINYEERGRGIMVERGQIVAVDDKGAKNKVGTCGDADALLGKIKFGDWNTYRIVAKGNKLHHYINDVLMSELQDGEAAKRSSEGIIALQVHQGPPMKVQFRNIMLTE